MARTLNGQLTGRAGAEELRGFRRSLEESALNTEARVCADCKRDMTGEPFWLSAFGKLNVCADCNREIEAAKFQAGLWAQDQLGGKDRRRGWLAGIYRMRQEILDGELSAAWVSELHKVIAIVWEYVVHDWNLARKGAAR